MGLTACAERQCLYKGELYLYQIHLSSIYVTSSQQLTPSLSHTLKKGLDYKFDDRTIVARFQK